MFAQVGLHCRRVSDACPYDVAGFSLASVPGVVIGHNASIAWGLTTSHLDVQDLYLEEVNDDRVREGDSFVPLRTITEEIRVRGEDRPRPITIRFSRHGPLLSDVSLQLQRLAAGQTRPPDPAYAVALSWVALTPGRTMDAVLAIGQAQDFVQFREAASLLAAPSQNLVYADTKGNIGYQLPGAVPRRGKGDGRSPSPGWDPAYDWRGTIPFAELPWVYNPPGGVLVAANQPVIGGQYPYPLGSSYSYGWRSQQLIDRLRETSDLTLEQAEQLFYDDTIRVAAELVPDAAQDQGCRPVGGRGAADPGRLGLLGGAGVGRGRVLQRGDARHLEADLPRRAARGALAGRRRPVERGSGRPDQAAAQPVVGRRVHPGR